MTRIGMMLLALIIFLPYANKNIIKLIDEQSCLFAQK